MPEGIQKPRCSILGSASLLPDGGMACELSPEDLKSSLPARKAVKIMDRRTQLACGAALKVMKVNETLDAGMGIAVATGPASLGEGDLESAFANREDIIPEEMPALLEKNLQPLWLLGRLPNMAAGHLSIQFRIQGPSQTCGGGSLAGIQALSCAARWLRRGEAKKVLAGATESYLEKHWQTALGNLARQPVEAATFFLLSSEEAPHSIAFLDGPIQLARKQFLEFQKNNHELFLNASFFCDIGMKESLPAAWNIRGEAMATWRVGVEMEFLSKWVQKKKAGTIVRLLDEENAVIFSVTPRS